MNEDFDAKKFKTKTNLNEYTKLLKANGNIKRNSKTNSFNINSSKEPISSNSKIIINSKIMSKLSIHENSLTKTKNQLLNNINKLKLNNANDDRSSNTSNLNNLNLVNNLLQENKLNYVYVKDTQNVLLQNQKINQSQFQTKVIANSQVNSYRNSPRTIILQALSPEYKNNNNNIRFSSNEKIYLDAGNNNYIKNKTTTKKKDYQKLNYQQNNNIEFIDESISKEIVFNNLLSVSKLINPEKENNIMKIKLDANNQNYDKELLMPNLKSITVSKSTKDSSSTKNNANGDFSNLDCPEELHFYNINLIKQTKKFLSYKFDNTDPYDLKIE